MKEFQENPNKLKEEAHYLKQTLSVIKQELTKAGELAAQRRAKLIASRKEMYESSNHSSEDFDRLTEMNQHLSEVTSQTGSYQNTARMLDRYKRLLDSPYFGRFDFEEYGFDSVDKIYVGLGSVIDSSTQDILVYDWRAPVSSIFYQYGLGQASYSTPAGETEGEVKLKRQYKIDKSELIYFFDSSIRINDELLQEVLCQNSSVQMRSIVETIQREQDIVIRDTENELLIVQGAAGSGKTAIALHRVAYLLYYGLKSNLKVKDIIIISPNQAFSHYIANVLPELGEENVTQLTFDEDIAAILDKPLQRETRAMQLEKLIGEEASQRLWVKESAIAFKGSIEFVELLNRLIWHYERNMLQFEDVYYDNKVIETKEQLRNFFLNNKIDVPVSKRLERIEMMLLKKIRPLQKERLPKIQKLVQAMEGHELEIKAFSRLLSVRRTNSFVKNLRRFTVTDYFKLYGELFKNKKLIYELGKDMVLPHNLEDILQYTREMLDGNQLPYEDCGPLLYLKLKLEGFDKYNHIKQVLIDEAQDYSPIQYSLYKLLFKNAFFTVLGDINQRIDKNIEADIYDQVLQIFNKRKSAKIQLNKCYRSSAEISKLTQRVLGEAQQVERFERHETEPVIEQKSDSVEMIEAIKADIQQYYTQGFETMAVLCKTAAEAAEVYEKLKTVPKAKLIAKGSDDIQKGIMIMPIYLAKGLEFDAVFVYQAGKAGFHTSLDRRLMYIACTRALHRLVLYYTGEVSSFLQPGP